MSKPIQLDGSAGGGQMLRSALTLALITGEPFRMVNIRGQRSKPGLMRQHLTCVRAAEAISGGSSSGAEIGSSELIFRAGAIQSGEYDFEIGTAGSTILLLQTLLPALAATDGGSRVTVSGGTHNPLAPCWDFFQSVYLSALTRFGIRASSTLHETGFVPAGGGKVECEISREPSSLQPIDFTDRGDLLSNHFTVIQRDIPEGIAERMVKAATKRWPDAKTTIETRDPEGPGRGIVCYAEVGTAHHRDGFVAHGEHGVKSERVAGKAIKASLDYIGSGAGVGTHLADQLLLPMALAGGGMLTTLKVSRHIRTNIKIIEAFLPVRFRIEEGSLPKISVERR
ncbi:MAG: RNA 3'-terminal phosphate cyclase [Verrucomicrobiota bacterium]